MKPRRRRIVLGLLAIVALALVLIVIGLFPQEPLRQALETRLRQTFGPATRVGHLRVVPGRLEAILEDVVLDSPTFHAEIPRAHLLLGAETFMGRALSLRSLELDEPRIRIRIPSEPGAAGALGRPLRVGSLVLRKGSLTLEHPALGAPLHFQGLDAEGSLGSGALEVRISGGVWDRPSPLALGPAYARLKLSPLLDVELQQLDAATGGSRLHASGPLGRLGALAPRIEFAVDADLAELSRIAGGTELAGRAEAHGRLGADAAGFQLESDVEPRSAVVGGVPVDGGRIHVLHSGGETTLSPNLVFLGGTLSGEARLKGTTTRGSLKASGLDAARLRALVFTSAPPIAGTVDGRASWSGDLVRGVSLRLNMEGSGAAARFSSLRLNATAEGSVLPKARRLDLRWDGSLQGEGATGSLLSGFTLTGSGSARGGESLAWDGQARGSGVLQLPAGPRDVSLEATLKGAGPVLSATAQLQGLGGSAAIEGESDASRVRRLVARGTGLDLALVSPDAAGVASFELSSSGPFDRLALQGRARIEAAAWRNVALGPVDVDLGGDTRAALARLSVPDLHASGEARITTGPVAALQASVDLDRTPLAALAPLLPTPVEGSVSGRVEIEGPLGTPGALRVTARVQAADAATRWIEVRAARPMIVSFERGVLQIQDLELFGEGLRLVASGTLALEPGAESSLHAVAAADLGQLPAPKGWQLAGKLDADVMVAGSVRRPRLTGALTATSVEATGPRLPPVGIAEGRIELAGETAVFDGLTARVAGGQASLSGRAPLASILESARRRRQGLDPDEQASLRLTWTGLDAAALLAWAHPGAGPPLSGALTGEASLEGGLRSLDEMRARLSSPATSLEVEDLLVEVGPVAVALEGGVATLSDAVVATRGSTVTLKGNVDLKRRRLDASGAGRLDLRALSPFLDAASISGTADVDVKASGPFEAPHAQGTLNVADGTLRLKDIPQAITDIGALVVFDESLVRIENGTGVLGGGAITVAGTAALRGRGLSDVALVLTGREMALRYPVGLRTRADADLRLDGRPGAFRLSGSVKARSGRYDLDLVLEEGLRRPAAKPSPSPLLRSVALEVSVDVTSPILVRNNLADVRVAGHLSMRGDLESPEPYGQLGIERGGHVYLQGRPFDAERGFLIYDGTWDPELDVSLTSQILESGSGREYSVTVTASGSLASPRLGFSASPPLSEVEIRSLIATGGLTASGMESSRMLAGDQAASLLTGRLGRGIAEGLGLDQVSIQPQLLSREQELGAKFIFGKRLTRQVTLAYSLSLNDAEDRFIELTARPWRSVTSQVQVREDGTYSFGAGQRLEFGGPSAPRVEGRRGRLKLADVRLEGDSPLPEAEMRSVLGLKAGSRATSWDVQDRADKLREALIQRGYLEAEVAARLDQDIAIFRVRAGSRYRWVVEGMSAPPSFDKAIRSALFADDALEIGRERLLQELRSQGHVRADVKARIVDEPEGRRLVFAVKPGPRYDVAEVRFPGATAISEGRLLQVSGGAPALLGSERVALEAIRWAYAEIQHLAAEAGPVRVREEGSRLFIEVPVQEGPAARIAALRLEGSSLPQEEAAGVLGLSPGAPYDPNTIDAASRRLREHYLGLGYPRVRLTPRAATVGADVEVTYQVTEGPRLVVGTVEIVGATRTRRSIILGKLSLKPGDPLDLRKVVRSERKLRDLALFRRVVITYSDDSPSALRIEVEEDATFMANYQLRYNREDGATAVLDGEARNLAGTGLTLGGRYRRGANVDEQRASLDLPSFFGGRFTAFSFRLIESLPIGLTTGEDLGRIRRAQRGVQVQQTFPFRDHWDFLAGLQFKQTSTRSPVLQDPIVIDIASLNASVVRETRDNPLDSRRGEFLSLSLEMSPQALGSDITFIKGFAQAFVSRPVGKSLTWAQGYRLGLATGFGGQRLIFTDRFKAGGANSLRGFPTDSVGPRDSFGDPTGGQAVLILNQELRLRYGSALGAAVFYDGGNVFASVRDFRLALRHVLGVGIRYYSPVGPLRLDVGFPLSREPGEKAYQLFFSVGQAF